MALELHPRISRGKRQTAIEQTSDLLKAYLKHWPDPFATRDEAPEPDESEDRSRDLAAGFLIPQQRPV